VSARAEFLGRLAAAVGPVAAPAVQVGVTDVPADAAGLRAPDDRAAAGPEPPSTRPGADDEVRSPGDGWRDMAGRDQGRPTSAGAGRTVAGPGTADGPTGEGGRAAPRGPGGDREPDAADPATRGSAGSRGRAEPPATTRRPADEPREVVPAGWPREAGQGGPAPDTGEGRGAPPPADDDLRGPRGTGRGAEGGERDPALGGRRPKPPGSQPSTSGLVTAEPVPSGPVEGSGPGGGAGGPDVLDGDPPLPHPPHPPHTDAGDDGPSQAPEADAPVGPADLLIPAPESDEPPGPAGAPHAAGAATAVPSARPELRIGLIEVVVEAPERRAGTTDRRPPPADLAGRHHLRRF
jgi:hypothetical protein